MNVLVCGARGFIGRHIVAALEAAGHTVRRGVSAGVGPDQVEMDFARDDHASVWLPRLEGVQAVVNAVGVLRDSARRPMRQVHAEVPKALFEACALRGVRRVVQVSALGIEGNATLYASSKRQADQRLLALNDAGRLDGAVLRPSIVYGPGGASAALFDRLSRWPLLVLPRIVMAARVQPLLARELALAVARLLAARPSAGGVLACVGPRPLTLAGFIASLRAQRGYRPARQIALPDSITRMSARLGDLFPVTPWGSEALALLGTDNTADPAPFAAVLGHVPTDPDHFLQPPPR